MLDLNCTTKDGNWFLASSYEGAIYFHWPQEVFYFNNAKLEIVKAFDSAHKVLKAKEIIIAGELKIDSFTTLELIAQQDIIFRSGAKITSSAPLYLKAGMGNGEGQGRVVFENIAQKQIYMGNNSKAYIYYNPEGNIDSQYSHKYHHPYKYSKHVEPKEAVTSYMLVNDVQDLQNIKAYLHGNYALSSNIDASATKNWNEGKGFEPLTSINGVGSQPNPFSGNFDGNGFSIFELFINRSMESYIGLFGITAGYPSLYVEIKNLVLANSSIVGNQYVGVITGMSEYTAFNKVSISNTSVTGVEIVGGIVGTGQNIKLKHIAVNTNVLVTAEECAGLIIGAIKEAVIYNSTDNCSIDEITSSAYLDCFGYMNADSVTINTLVEAD